MCSQPAAEPGSGIDVQARVHREGKHYVIDISGWGITQADSPRAIVLMAQDYVASLAGVNPREVRVQLVS